ncbi:DUF3090 domain-containing protein [Arthrobacter agilis]|uniref:DUF3090 domain-containing protein n=1 Tax=Arthrobacter agilis TaxID=37921 RepID=UPI000B34B8F3|nr:DUF3090 domain-containing protein [Arthrobacter agilis]OUM44459.1 hypothetical protein B8W74_03070 [Arthrobacter agilis]PPB47363.1 DUF3090 domain-containing protein [Arthrobacter agilis]TPV22847.1 DUF3090 domain-containing protein [Arthrobacter agilis]VDR32100.1 Protein of uncharacterised function (DUF3090) [Arthrobacter agilis]
MPTIVHEFTWPDRVVVGTIGRPGERTFYLQVRTGKQIVSIAMEKQQSALLAEKIDEILDQLIALDGNPFSIPTGTPIELVDNDQLDTVEEQFRTGAMSLGWDPTTAQVVVEAYPLSDAEGPDDEPEDDAPEMLLVRMPVGTARAFAQRTREVVGAGRPICSLCGQPIDPDGHICLLPEV